MDIDRASQCVNPSSVSKLAALICQDNKGLKLNSANSLSVSNPSIKEDNTTRKENNKIDPEVINESSMETTDPSSVNCDKESSKPLQAPSN